MKFYYLISTQVIYMLILFFPAVAHAQQKNNNYSITHYTNENGLPQNSITDMVMDSNGFLWMTTQYGVCRFDGQRFRAYDTYNTPAFSNDRFTSVSLSSGGKIIIEQPAASVAGENYFAVTADNKMVKDSLRSNSKRMVIRIGTEPFDYTNLDSTGVQTSMVTKDMLTGLIHTEWVWTVNDHEAYVYYNKTIFYINTITRQVKAVQHTVSDYKYIPVIEMPMVLVGDVFLYIDDTGAVTALRNGQLQSKPPLTANAMTLLMQAANKNAGIKFFESGKDMASLFLHEDIYMLRYKDGIIDSHLQFEKTGLARFTQVIAYDDETATTFIGTNTRGLYVLKNKELQTIIQNNEETISNSIYAQMDLDNGDIINNLERYTVKTQKTQPIPGCNGYSFLKLADGSVLFSKNGGILKSDKHFTNFKQLGYLDSSFYQVTCFIKDRQQQVWFSTEGSVGMVYNDSITVKLKHSPAFKDTRIGQLFDYSNDTLWVVCENGIYPYCKKDNKLAGKVLLPGNIVRNIYRTRDNSIWVGTYGQGFYKYLDGKFVAMPLDAKKSLNITHSFYEDNNGLFWITTNNGLLVCKKICLDMYASGNKQTTVPYHYYNTDDGLATNEFNGGCNPAYLTINGELFYPSMMGIVHFFPDSLRPATSNSAIFLDNVLADGKQLNDTAGFQLDPGFALVQFAVVSPYFGKAENLSLEYKLEGLNDTWYPLPGSSVISFNSLSKGNYTLLIRKQQGVCGKGNYLYKAIPFMVKPWWYETWWFRSLMALIIALILYLVFRRRLRWLVKQKALLQEQVKQRTLALNDSVIHLNHTITELHQSEQELNDINIVQEKAIALILHDIQSPLGYLSSSAQYFNRQAAEMSTAEINQYAGSLAQSSFEINNFSRDLLQWLISKRKDFEPQPVTFDPAALLQEIVKLYYEIAKFNGNSIKVIAGPGRELTTDKNILKLIIRNLLDNANKNCTDGVITLSSGYDSESGKILISISDTGKGLTAEEIEVILHGREEDTNLFRNGKLGFTLVQDFVRLINGEISIQSEKEKGTTVMIGLF